ncbi:hypothetical protein [Clostridium pasteurianum]|nr:hypothetical protein [Clostridium pasteurianum]
MFNRICIKYDEIKSMVNKKLKLVFFVPIILGFAIGSSYNFITALITNKIISILFMCFENNSDYSIEENSI